MEQTDGRAVLIVDDEPLRTWLTARLAQEKW